MKPAPVFRPQSEIGQVAGIRALTVDIACAHCPRSHANHLSVQTANKYLHPGALDAGRVEETWLAEKSNLDGSPHRGVAQELSQFGIIAGLCRLDHQCLGGQISLQRRSPLPSLALRA